FASTSTFATFRPFASFSVASWSRTGAIIRHGPHHSAQKSTTTRPLCPSTSPWKVASVTSIVFDPAMSVSSTLECRPMLPPDVAAQARLAHVGVAVRDLDDAVRFYRDVLGVTPHPPQQADGATIVGLSLGGSEVELLTATDAESPIGKFLATRGPGIHH